LLDRQVEGARGTGEDGEKEAAREALLAQKHLTYEDLKDLDFELASGKLSEADYQAMKQEMEAEAIRLLKELDALEGEGGQAPEPDQQTCPSCGRATEPDNSFCHGCGVKLR
ncbi:MAG: hypothetical protein ACE1ZU_07985, partial [bacterium]